MQDPRAIRRVVFLLMALAVPFLTATEARADRLKAAREAAELVFKRFGGKAAGESTEKLASRIASAAAKHGDDALPAIRQLGTRAIELADEAGEHGPRVMRLLARHGDGAVLIARNPQALALAAKHGDEAAEAIIRSKGVGLPLVSQYGEGAVKAFKGLDPQNARRLAMLGQSGELAATGRASELLGVVGKHGQPVMEFIWKNKGALAVGTTLTAFLANPEPFVSGTADLAGTVVEASAEHVAQPLITAAVPAVQETASAAFRLVTVLITVAGLGLAALVASGLWKPAYALLRQQPGFPSPASAPPEQKQA
ncbi:hypothetical protein [Tautonia marina]|uniref:hypothetical protein n=1 Tax=Tautonia marina TaxID=2653855 RepID=UPI0012603FDD|nr:hypothetical protein [Tautonia marina]